MAVGGRFASAKGVRSARVVGPNGSVVTMTSRFPGIIAGLEMRTRVASRESAENILEDAQNRAPEGSRNFVDPETGEWHPGLLKDSLYLVDLDIAEDWAVASDLRYAPYVEFGTSVMPAQPFLIPALEAERGPYIARTTAALQAL